MSEIINIESIADYKVEEAVRRLSVNISNSYSDVKSILVTSVAGKEGKSFVSLQFARVLAGRGNKVIYINGDIRSELSSQSGLADYMDETADIKKIIYESNCKNLSIIPSGKKKVMIGEVLLEKLLREVKEAYDYVIVDSPSLGEVSDGIVIGKLCDGVLLVVEPEIVPEKKLLGVKEELERSGCKILGVVLNKEMN